MRRTAPTLDAFDPELREAAREAARRAGLSVDEWLAEAISEGSARAGVRQQTRRAAGPRRGRPDSFQPQGFPDVGNEGRRPERGRPHEAPRAQRPRHAGGPVAESAPLQVSPPQASPAVAAPVQAATIPAPPAPAVDAGLIEAVAAIGRRLDAIDRRISESREAVDGAVAKAVQEPREAPGKAAQGDEPRLAEHGSTPHEGAARPAGRRARPAPNSLAAAVAEIRQRQQQLDDGHPEVDQEILVDGLRRDLARVMETAEAAADKLSPAIAGLQAETSRLRESIGTLATSGDLMTLEQAVRTLSDEVQRARDPADLVAVAGPIDLMRVQVGRLAEDVAANVHARVAQDVERLAQQVGGALDGTAGADRAGFADRDAIAKLFGELEEIRGRLAALAEPARVQNLAKSVDELTETVTRLGNGMLDSPALMNELRPLLEEIREGVRAPGSDAPALAQGIADLDRKLDDLRAERHERPDTSGDILGRIDALSAKVDQVAAVSTVGDVMDRLEQIGEALRQPALPSSDLASIHGMLRSLADKLDRVGQGAGGETLDGLERQVLALASRIDTRGSDPALAGLERTMGDLLAQVALLRDEAPIQAAAERAARSVADSIGAERKGAESEGLGGLQAVLADMRAQQAASDKRLQATMEGVHSALEQLVARLTHLDGDRRSEAAPAAAAPRTARTLRDSLRETTAPVPEPRPARRPEAPRAGPPSPAEEMIEPGALRPRQAHAEIAPAPEMPAADIKASFIAAARRAAQAAAAEAAGTSQAPLAAERSVESRGSLVERLRAAIEHRRRPLLLGIAAIVLALGTLQALQSARTSAPAVSREATAPVDPATTQATGPSALPKGAPPVAAPAATASADAKAADSKGNDAKGSDAKGPDTKGPDTKGSDTRAVEANRAAAKPESYLQKGAETGPSETTKPALAARPTPPRVTDMASLSHDLAGIPAGAASLRQAALEGDGAAIYELASRAVDGRGLPRDTALAAKLFDRLAGAGYAPAQYRLGSQYEKGLGLVRDQEKARLWYGRAAVQGHVRAMHNLAVMLAESGAAGGKPDYTSAATWFRKAAEYGVRDSQYNLAVLLARGLGVTQDLSQAYGWFAAAAAQGDDDAGRKRDEVAGKLAPKDLAAARSAAEAWKAKIPDPAVNDPPAARVETAATPGAMSLIGAPPPLSVGKGVGTGKV